MKDEKSNSQYGLIHPQISPITQKEHYKSVKSAPSADKGFL
jgi:hypothetical protein